MKEYTIENENSSSIDLKINDPKPFFEAIFTILFDYVAYASESPKYQKSMIDNVKEILKPIKLAGKSEFQNEISDIEANIQELIKL